MKLLVVPPHYPHPAAEWVGAPNEHSACALRELVEHVEILAPRPYAPRIVAITERWRAYSCVPGRYTRRGLQIHRPAYPVLPKVFQAFWPTHAAFVCCRQLARRLHSSHRFDAILSFDLAMAGGVAWRLGRHLGIPACGWATGTDIRSRPDTPAGRSLRETLQRLDLVFYQSDELRRLGAGILGMRPDELAPDRLVVQPRGVAEPAAFPGVEVRRALRARLGLTDEHLMILYLGRLVRGKGVIELVQGFRQWGRHRPELVLVLVGSIPGFDDTERLRASVRDGAEDRIHIVPACEPPRVWEWFTTADIFAFPSFREGMPNSLLEAMLAGLPAVSFAIPAVREITQHGGGLLEVPAFDFDAFGSTLLKLAADASLRRETGERGRAIVRKHFSIRASARAVVDHLQRLTAAGVVRI